MKIEPEKTLHTDFFCSPPAALSPARVKSGPGILHFFHIHLSSSAEDTQIESGGNGINISLDYDLFLNDNAAVTSVAGINGKAAATSTT